MQETADSIVKFVGIWMAAASTILVLCAPLVGLIVSACVAAGWLKADSGIAVFVAKLFPLSLHAQSGKPKLPPVGPAVALLFAIGASVTQVGCSALPWSKTIYEQWRAVCGKDLASRADVAAEAKARGLGVADFAEALCELSDVVAPFARSASPGAPKRLAPPGDEAVAVAKALGAMR